MQCCAALLACVSCRVMKVAKLIEALRTMPTSAQVVIEDASAHPGPAVRRLGNGEVQCIELG